MASRFTILNFDFYSVTSWASNYDICNSKAIAFLQGYASTMEQHWAQECWQEIEFRRSEST